MKLKIRIFFHLFSTNLMLVIAVPDFFKEKQNANEIYLVKLRSAYFFQNNPIFWYYRQYCLITGLYMLEPWEQSLFNCVIFAVFLHKVFVVVICNLNTTFFQTFKVSFLGF
ncbi:Uncharacterized protein BM_BM3362 [Brugia malayi]|uniref:Bm3362 n=1 Tax=Brugia malayi TaxID=6279 RepID=A0A0J9XVW1_BRUMA|nr:Uncharacterized protein BM_BM3362 [Brugia malayi]CDP96314.1 Bm3362 [Brugia malayi]VIO98420.1 Uncharacterized protein BM_BM3362 [Brugia malayi]